MKRVGQRVIVIGLLASAGLLTAAPGPGAEEVKKCSLETLEGQYLFASTGALFPPAFGVTEQSISTSAGFSIFNGDGTGTDYVTFAIDGVDAHVPSPTRTRYTLNANCTGTITVLPSGPHFNIFVAIDGSEFTSVSTSNGFAVASTERRVGRSR